VRLTWNGGEGTIFEGDAAPEKQRRRIGAPELGRLLVALTALDPLRTDRDRPCGPRECEAIERALTINTSCSEGVSTFTFDGSETECRGPWSPGLAPCLAQNAWDSVFATHLAGRFLAVFDQLCDAGRGG
jgi:hypothetical protein